MADAIFAHPLLAEGLNIPFATPGAQRTGMAVEMADLGDRAAFRRVFDYASLEM
jgi:hypothetical protein